MYKFYSFHNISTQGKQLLTILGTQFPEHFQVALHNYNKSPIYMNDISGLFCRYEGSKIVCVCLLLHLRVDRIFTIPKYRGLGYADKVLRLLNSISTLIGIGLSSPILPEIEKLYTKANWIRLGNKINPDGTIDMITPLFKEGINDGTLWLAFLESV